ICFRPRRPSARGRERPVPRRDAPGAERLPRALALQRQQRTPPAPARRRLPGARRPGLAARGRVPRVPKCRRGPRSVACENPRKTTIVIDVIYVEREALGYPLAAQVMRRHPKARVIEIERHGALFNRASQNFRLQKNRPALVLAVKHGRAVLPVPDGYGLGGSRNFYFSHMLNCLYDCRYCFLQGMY